MSLYYRSRAAIEARREFARRESPEGRAAAVAKAETERLERERAAAVAVKAEAERLERERAAAVAKAEAERLDSVPSNVSIIL